MTTTRTSVKKVFEHALATIMDQPQDSELSRALQQNHITTLQDVMIMSTDDISALTYKGDDGKIIPVHRSRQALLKAFQAFIRYNVANGVTDYLT